MEDERPTASRGLDDEENEEDALPDWTHFAKFARTNLNNPEGFTANAVFIPKRGEKDFEPVPSSSSSDLPQSSKQATLSAHQLATLNESRNALFSALSSGARFHSSKGHNSFTWRPELEGGRATCNNGTAAYGIQFGPLGKYSTERKRLELLPEEALFMLEKGALELFRERKEGELEDEIEKLVPMTAEEGWAEIIGHDKLTLERFAVYTFFRRLGYILVRARTNESEKLSAAPPAILKRSLLASLSLSFISFRRLISNLSIFISKNFARNKIILGLTRILKDDEGNFKSLVTGRRWATYNQIFRRLQIIPTGHDSIPPRGPLPHIPSVLTPLIAAPSISPKDNLPDLQNFPYQTFYHVYKPSTPFKKSNPPPPDFHMVIINTATTPLPDLFECHSLFSTLPLNKPLPPRTPIVRAKNAAPLPVNPRFKPRPKLIPIPPTLYSKIKSYLPAWPGTGLETRKHPKSLYPELKRGVKSVLVAVVDHGTISTMIFSQSEFGKLAWMGGGRSS